MTTTFVSETDAPAALEPASEMPDYMDESLPSKTRKALIRRRQANIDLEIMALQHQKTELRDLHGSLK